MHLVTLSGGMRVLMAISHTRGPGGLIANTGSKTML